MRLVFTNLIRLGKSVLTPLVVTVQFLGRLFSSVRLNPMRMLLNENNSMPYMKSLATCVNRMITDGYTEDFKVTEQGLESLTNQKNYKPEQIQIVNFFRFEGMSDPDDNAVLYVIETADGTKGTLIDAYGIYNDARIGRFMKDVEQIQKKVIKT
jgi:hypothetical protein